MIFSPHCDFWSSLKLYKKKYRSVLSFRLLYLRASPVSATEIFFFRQTRQVARDVGRGSSAGEENCLRFVS